MNIIDVLIPLTKSPNSEVCGNSAAALANLCSRIQSYKIILQHYDEISEFISNFLKSRNPTFEHIALWTILQLLESNNKEIKDKIKKEISKGKIDLSNLTGENNDNHEISNLTIQILDLIKWLQQRKEKEKAIR